jgi:ankyrin repeat protein
MAEGRWKIVQVLLEYGADANVHDKDGQTLLHLASKDGDLDFAQLLLDHGADANARGSNRTALHLASQRGHLKVVQLLLNRGADPNASDKNNQIPLHLVSQKRHL